MLCLLFSPSLLLWCSWKNIKMEILTLKNVNLFRSFPSSILIPASCKLSASSIGLNLIDSPYKREAVKEGRYLVDTISCIKKDNWNDWSTWLEIHSSLSFQRCTSRYLTTVDKIMIHYVLCMLVWTQSLFYLKKKSLKIKLLNYVVKSIFQYCITSKDFYHNFQMFS